MEPHFEHRDQSNRSPAHAQAPGRTPEDIVSFVERRLAFHPDEIQQTILRSTAKRGILNCTRQWGKTTVSAAKAVHRAFTVPKSLIVVAAPSLRQSGEWMRRAADMLARLKIRKRGDGNNRISLVLPNGSRIVGLPESEATIRGFAALEMLIIDEAARVSDETYRALRPMLSTSNGEIWMMSTPFGKQGFFYETWEHDTDWLHIQVTAQDCPRISPEFLEEQRRVMGIDSFNQEHMCQFIGSGHALFDPDLIDAAFDPTIEAL